MHLARAHISSDACDGPVALQEAAGKCPVLFQVDVLAGEAMGVAEGCAQEVEDVPHELWQLQGGASP